MLIPFGVFSAGVPTGSTFDLISTTIMTGTTSSVTWNVSGLSSTYKHLQIRWTGRDAGTSGDFYIQVNGDGGSNYSAHRIIAGTGGVSSSSNVSAGAIYTGTAANTNDTSGAFAAGITDIIEPFSTTKYKTVKALTGVVSSNIFVAMRSGAWLNTSAITSITMYAGGGGFITGSRFSLYGIKG
jgi:hypothetical protein